MVLRLCELLGQEVFQLVYCVRYGPTLWKNPKGEDVVLMGQDTRAKSESYQ